MTRCMIALLLLVAASPALAQTEIWSSVLASGGGTTTAGDVRMDSTLGQMVLGGGAAVATTRWSLATGVAEGSPRMSMTCPPLHPRCSL